MNPKGPNPKLFLSLGALGILVSASVLTLQWNAVTEERFQAQQLDNKVKAQRDVPKQLMASKAELEQVRSKLAHLEKNVPDFAYIPTMLRELEAAGRASGLEVTGVRPIAKTDNAKAADGKGEKKPYDAVDIEVRGRGPYGAIMRFVDALKAFPKIVESRAVSIEPKADPMHPKAAPQLEMTVRLRAYIFNEAREPDSTDPDAALDKTAMSGSGGAHAG